MLRLPEIEIFVRYKQRETLETHFCVMIIIASKNSTAMSTLILVQW